jgi:hypothetical protein
MLGTLRSMLCIRFAHVKLRVLLRRASARTRETLSTIIGQLLHTFSSAECRNYLANSDMRSTKLKMH